MSHTVKTQSLTLLMPAGKVPLEVMEKAHSLAAQYNLEIYISTRQNLRLNNVPVEIAEEIKTIFHSMGVTLKAPCQFSIPRVCVGKDHCKLGVIDTAALSSNILAHFTQRKQMKEKVKISIGGCNLGCSGSKLTDIGIEATRAGYTVYAGGKGGVSPQTGRRIKRNIEEPELLETIEQLIDFHDLKTGKKQRMFKLLDDPDFPFPAV